MYALIVVYFLAAGGVSSNTTYFSDQTACEVTKQKLTDDIRHFPVMNYSMRCVPTGLDSGQASGHGTLPDTLIVR